MKLLTLTVLLSFSLFAQPSPTQQQFVSGNNGGSTLNQFAQLRLLRAATVGQPISEIVLGAHNLFLGAGLTINNSTPITLGATNAYTDSLNLAGVTALETNIDMDLFVANSAISANLANYDAAWQHAISDSMTIKLDMSVNETANLAHTSRFTNDACNPAMGNVTTCDTTTTPCSSAAPCFDTFAHFQAYYLGGSGPVSTMLTRWGGTTAGQGMSASLIAVSLAHELSQLTCSALNPNWTTSSQCTAANWQAFGNAAVTLIRGISAGICTNCPANAAIPMDISLVVLLNTDAPLYATATCTTACVCAAASTLSSCGVDVYVQPTNNVVNFLTGNIPTFVGGVKCCTGRWYVEETVPPNWVPSNTPQPEGNAYRAGANNDWNRYTLDREWLRAWTMYFAAAGAYRLALFDTYKLFWYTTAPSCPGGPNVVPAACGAPNLSCGTNGLQCFGDITTQNPFISNIAAQLTAKGAGVNPLGTLWNQLVNQWFTGAF